MIVMKRLHWVLLRNRIASPGRERTDPDLTPSPDQHTSLSREDGQEGALTSVVSLDGQPFRADVLAGRSNPGKALAV